MSISATIRSLGKKLVLAAALSPLAPVGVAPAIPISTPLRVVAAESFDAIVNREFLVLKPFRPIRKETNVLKLHHAEEVALSTVKHMQDKQLCNFATDTTGMRYEIVPENRIAAHSGKGIWGIVNGLGERLRVSKRITYSKMDAESLCHEAVGYNSAGLLPRAVISLREFIAEKKTKYPGIIVVSHGSYSAEINPWSNGKPARGRKTDTHFPWSLLGLDRRPRDVELETGVVAASPLFRRMYELERAQPEVDPRKLFKVVYGSANSQETTHEKTPWDIAGVAFDEISTIYKLPDGRVKRGTEIPKLMDWNDLALGTLVIPGLNYLDPKGCTGKIKRRAACRENRNKYNIEELKKVKSDVLYFEEGKLVHRQLPMAWDDSTTLYIRPDNSYHFGHETKPYGVADSTRAILGVTGVTPHRDGGVLILRGKLPAYILRENLVLAQ